jgi:hypothetical protein
MAFPSGAKSAFCRIRLNCGGGRWKPSRLGNLTKIFFLLALAFFAVRAGAVSVTNNSVADTSLLEFAPSNNNGGQAFVISGHIQNPGRARGLYQFNLTGLPTNAVILSVVLELTVTRQPGDGLANSAFSVHRMSRSWGEGNKIAIHVPGQGLAAGAGEATWLCAFHPTNAWTSPGGEPDVDFVSSESSFQSINVAGESYRFESTPELVGDVQAWVSNPSSNFGWMLICDDEATPFTARHFGSREDPGAHPNLEIQYLVPPHIDSAQRTGNQFNLTFTTRPGQTYTVEFRASSSSGVWQTLTNLGLATNVTPVLITDTVIASQRFYRVVSF